MVKGLYTAYTGLINQQNRLDVVSNNLANSTTTGFKKEGCTSQSFDDVMAINTWDLALTGDGFFSVSFTNKAGEESIMYTRDGSFTTTQDGYLVTKDGDYVLGQNGYIQVDPDATISVDEMGNIFADNQQVDQLQIVDFEDYNYLEAYGENLYRAVDGATEKDATSGVMQGYLEMSNVNVVQEMVQMITISRAFETNQKVMNSIDETLGKAVTLGQVQ